MQQIQSFQRVRFLNRHVFRENCDFHTSFRLLQRCYPWTFTRLAALLGTSIEQLWRWRHGQAKPRQTVIVQMIHLIGFRIGCWEYGADLLKARKLLSTGRLERMVDAFLAAEAANIAAGRARAEARKRAKSETQRDIPPIEPTK